MVADMIHEDTMVFKRIRIETLRSVESAMTRNDHGPDDVGTEFAVIRGIVSCIPLQWYSLSRFYPNILLLIIIVVAE